VQHELQQYVDLRHQQQVCQLAEFLTTAIAQRQPNAWPANAIVGSSFSRPSRSTVIEPQQAPTPTPATIERRERPSWLCDADTLPQPRSMGLLKLVTIVSVKVNQALTKRAFEVRNSAATWPLQSV